MQASLGKLEEVLKREQVRNETDEDESVDSFDYFARSQSQDRHIFLSYHPQQTPYIAIPKVFSCRDETNCKWLTHCEKTQSLYCSVCLACLHYFVKMYMCKLQLRLYAYKLDNCRVSVRFNFPHCPPILTCTLHHNCHAKQQPAGPKNKKAFSQL